MDWFISILAATGVGWLEPDFPTYPMAGMCPPSSEEEKAEMGNRLGIKPGSDWALKGEEIGRKLCEGMQENFRKDAEQRWPTVPVNIRLDCLRFNAPGIPERGLGPSYAGLSACMAARRQLK